MADRIVFIGSHPDDIELGCGMLIRNLSDTTKDELFFVTITMGEGGGANRIYEQQSALECLCDEPSINFLAGFKDTELYRDEACLIDSLYDSIESFKPTCAFIHSAHDSHQDHITAHKASLVALSRLGVQNIYTYETPSTTIDFKPNMYFKGSSELMKHKINALYKHKSQSDKWYMSESTICTLASYRAIKGKLPFEYAEAFEIVRYILD